MDDSRATSLQGWEHRAARGLTGVYAVGAFAAVALWLLGRGRGHRSSWVETGFGLLNVPVGPSLVSVVVMVLVTRALLGRKRIGLVALAAFQVLGMYLGVVALGRWAGAPVWASWSSRGTLSAALDVVSLAVAVASLVLAYRVRGAFAGKLQSGSWPAAGAALGVGAALSVGATWLLLTVTDNAAAGEGWARLSAAVAGSLGDSDLESRRELLGVPGWIPQVTSVLVSATIVTAVVLFLRAARPVNSWSGERELAIRQLLAEQAVGDSLGYFATRRDKMSVFSPDGRAAVTYQVRAGVSLASGDPVGAQASWSAAIAAWRVEARNFGWVPAVLAASEDGGRAYAAAGLRVLLIGDEAVLEPERFTLGSTSMGPVRHAVRRAARAGIVVQARRQGQIAAGELEEIISSARRWRGSETDRGFSMALNREADPADARALVVTARDGNGILVGLLSLVPWGRGGLSLDVMRRDPAAPNGVTEAMVTHLMEQAAGLGVRRVSLNFCLFRGVYADSARLGASTLTRVNYSVLGVLDRFWQLERLYRSSEKYQPRWIPRFACYDDRLGLPQVALAAALAEGFLPSPSWGRSPGPQMLNSDQTARVRHLEGATTTADSARLEPRRSGQTRDRLTAMEALRAAGRDPYPVGGRAVSTPQDLAAGSATTHGAVRVAGRVRAIRDHGGVLFATLTEAGHGVQVLLERTRVGGDELRDFATLVDIGDLVAVDGTTGQSRTGSPVVVVETWTMLAKALHPVPFDGLDDPQTRLRHRSTHLLVHPQEGHRLRQRAAVVDALRQTLQSQGFLEVETPILHTVHGGATARPFRTFINAYGTDLSLRIAPELYLKRLVVGGLGPIFEIGRNFRNEGADATHNPEFTALEAYQPHADYTTMLRLTEELVRAAAVAVHGSAGLPLRPEGDQGGRAKLVDISEPWPVIPVLQAVSAAVGADLTLDTDFDVLLAIARAHAVAVHDDMGPGAVVEALYGELVEPVTTVPTFYIDFPVETSPLARPHRTANGLAERWDLVVNGVELGTAYSELTDPLEQRARLTAQSLRAAAGDPEAMELDEDFLYALETGMPPTGGLGIGVDRLVMLLTGTNIRSVLTFPFVRPQIKR